MTGIRGLRALCPSSSASLLQVERGSDAKRVVLIHDRQHQQRDDTRVQLVSVGVSGSAMRATASCLLAVHRSRLAPAHCDEACSRTARRQQRAQYDTTAKLLMCAPLTPLADCSRRRLPLAPVLLTFAAAAAAAFNCSTVLLS